MWKSASILTPAAISHCYILVYRKWERCSGLNSSPDVLFKLSQMLVSLACLKNPPENSPIWMTKSSRVMSEKTSLIIVVLSKSWHVHATDAHVWISFHLWLASNQLLGDGMFCCVWSKQINEVFPCTTSLTGICWVIRRILEWSQLGKIKDLQHVYTRWPQFL